MKADVEKHSKGSTNGSALDPSTTVSYSTTSSNQLNPVNVTVLLLGGKKSTKRRGKVATKKKAPDQPWQKKCKQLNKAKECQKIIEQMLKSGKDLGYTLSPGDRSQIRQQCKVETKDSKAFKACQRTREAYRFNELYGVQDGVKKSTGIAIGCTIGGIILMVLIAHLVYCCACSGKGAGGGGTGKSSKKSGKGGGGGKKSSRKSKKSGKGKSSKKSKK